MPDYQWYIFGMQATWAIFAFAYGACMGSLINVLVYRLPRGVNVVTPASRCPTCATRLGWRDNIPVFGWLMLKGRCRYCRARISPQYPLVELFVGLLFVLLYVLWYVVPEHAVLLGVDWGAVRGDYVTRLGAGRTWPTFIIILNLVAALVAMTLVDAKLFIIPIGLAWWPTVVGIVGHTAHAAWAQSAGFGPIRGAPGYDWTIPTPAGDAWDVALAAAGGFLGVLAASGLVAAGWLRRSFADYEAWEESVRAQQPKTPEGQPGTGAIDNPSPPPADDPAGDPAMWVMYPHARREVLYEVLFLAPVLGLGMLGWLLPRWLGLAGPMPLWFQALAGSLLGYLVGGGVVWAIRIFGSLAFGKEAMGLGDVHLMAAVGACLGWIDATLAFFGAAFVALALEVVMRVFSGKFRHALPFGPSLAISTVLVILGKPMIETGLGAILGRAVNLP